MRTAAARDASCHAMPARRSLVRLGVRAHYEGHMTIEGVLWTLNDVAHGKHELVRMWAAERILESERAEMERRASLLSRVLVSRAARTRR